MGGGSWFLFNTKTGNVAFLTNLYGQGQVEDSLSRGEIIKKFVLSSFNEGCVSGEALVLRIKAYLDEVAKNKSQYNAFNLVVGNLKLKAPLLFKLDFVSGEVFDIIPDTLHAMDNMLPSTPF